MKIITCEVELIAYDGAAYMTHKADFTKEALDEKIFQWVNETLNGNYGCLDEACAWEEIHLEYGGLDLGPVTFAVFVPGSVPHSMYTFDGYHVIECDETMVTPMSYKPALHEYQDHYTKHQVTLLVTQGPDAVTGNE